MKEKALFAPKVTITQRGKGIKYQQTALALKILAMMEREEAITTREKLMGMGLVSAFNDEATAARESPRVQSTVYFESYEASSHEYDSESPSGVSIKSPAETNAGDWQRVEDSGRDDFGSITHSELDAVQGSISDI
jgi:hypothetical protein